MNEAALVRPGPESDVFYRALKAMTRYLEADIARMDGGGLNPDLVPVDVDLFVDAFDLVYSRFAGMSHDDAKAAIRARVEHFNILQDYLVWSVKSLRDASPDVCRRLVDARNRVQHELGRLRIVYIAPHDPWPGYWTVLGDRVDS